MLWEIDPRPRNRVQPAVIIDATTQKEEPGQAVFPTTPAGLRPTHRVGPDKRVGP